MEREFIFPKREYGLAFKSEGYPIQTPPEYLKINDTKIIYFLSREKSGTAVIVPGIVKSDVYKTKSNYDAVKVEPIEEGSELENKVRANLKDKGYLSF